MTTELKTKRIPKEGAVNNKKKLKYCSFCNTWIPFRNWKKHGETHVHDVMNSADVPCPAESSWEDEKLDTQREQIAKLEADKRSLQTQLHKFHMEREQANSVLKAVGALLVAQHSEY